MDWREEIELKKKAQEYYEKDLSYNQVYIQGCLDGYAKGIDEFAEVIRGIHYNYPIGTDADTNEPLYAHEDGTWHNLLNDVAEQMKAGGKNE